MASISREHEQSSPIPIAEKQAICRGRAKFSTAVGCASHKSKRTQEGCQQPNGRFSRKSEWQCMETLLKKRHPARLAHITKRRKLLAQRRIGSLREPQRGGGGLFQRVATAVDDDPNQGGVRAAIADLIGYDPETSLPLCVQHPPRRLIPIKHHRPRAAIAYHATLDSPYPVPRCQRHRGRSLGRPSGGRQAHLRRIRLARSFPPRVKPGNEQISCPASP